MISRQLGVAVLSLMLSYQSLSAQELPQPSVQHQQLAREVGVWDAKSKTWMAPGTEPVLGTATETNTMLGGFWLLSEYKGDFQGTPFTGRSQLGYDVETEEYILTWIDSMAPALLIARGAYDVPTHTLTLEGEGTDWMTGEPKLIKMVTIYKDDNHKLFEIYEAPVGSDDWNKTLEIDYTKR